MRKLAAALVVALAVGVASDATAGAPVRSTSTIARAIGYARPSMPRKLRLRYAKIVKKIAAKHGFDPLTAVAIVDHESDWIETAVSADGEDFGLAQIRARYAGGCRKDIPASRDHSESCERTKARLLTGPYNLELMGKAITAHREFCRRHTGRPALFARWLASYGGYNRMSRGIVCNQVRRKGRWHDRKVPRQVARIIAYRKELVRLTKRR